MSKGFYVKQQIDNLIYVSLLKIFYSQLSQIGQLVFSSFFKLKPVLKQTTKTDPFSPSFNLPENLFSFHITSIQFQSFHPSPKSNVKLKTSAAVFTSNGCEGFGEIKEKPHAAPQQKISPQSQAQSPNIIIVFFCGPQ